MDPESYNTANTSNVSKKVKLRVSMERVFEIKLDKLVSKPDTMLGRMFSTSQDLAKPNENGEYEIKNVNPMLFKNVLNYYKHGKISKPNLSQELEETTDYLHISNVEDNFEDYFWSDLQEEQIILKDLNFLYYGCIEDLQNNDCNDAWYTINVIDQEREEECDSWDQPEVDNVKSFNYFVDSSTIKHLMKFDDLLEKFLKSKGVEDFRKEIGETDLELDDIDSYEDERCRLVYVVLEILC